MSRSPRRMLRLLVATALSVAVVGIAAPAVQAAAHPTATHPAAILKGTWVGSFSGYIDGVPTAGDEKFVITRARGSSAWGTVQWRDEGSRRWSAPLPVGMTLIHQDGRGTWTVSGGNETGSFTGVLRPNGRLNLGFVDTRGPIQVLRFNLTKR